ncbi:MAG: carboxypeptidase-like regulatory domain-containing protein [Acidobacteriota bacterium]|nr:carboxypeptidase-like regulatory domain-containing protein [Acidobacteriota bacterium]
MLLASRMPALLGALASCAVGCVSLVPQAVAQIAPASPAPATVEPLPGARVSGRLSTGDRELLSAAVIMTSEAGQPIGPDDAMFLPDGTFTFQNVPAGRYEIRARGEFAPGGTTHFASFRVLVEGRDISDLRLEMLPGATVTGTVVFESQRTSKPPSPAGIRVRAPLADGRSFGDALTGEVQPDGSYAIRGLMSGSHSLAVDGLRDPWVLKSVTYRGQDITDVGLEADARQHFQNVGLTVTDHATTLSGVVRDGSGRNVQDAVVLVIPLAQQFWHRTSRRLRLLRTDAQGRFTTRGLPAGEYRVVASVDVNEGDAYRDAVLQRLSEAGVPLSLAALEQRELDLPLTSAAAGPRTPGR